MDFSSVDFHDEPAGPELDIQGLGDQGGVHLPRERRVEPGDPESQADQLSRFI